MEYTYFNPVAAHYSNRVQSAGSLLLVVLVHVCVIYALLSQAARPVQLQYEKAMLVSLIAPPALKQALPPPSAQPLTKEQEHVAAPKKIVETIKPTALPTERLVEAPQTPAKETSRETPRETSLADPTTSTASAEAEATQETSVQKQAALQDEKSNVAQEDTTEISPPRFGVAYLNNPAPEYPGLSRRAGEEGRVLMRVLVSAKGLADEVSIEKSSGFERLDQAAMSAVKKWHFIPAKKSNQPLSAYVLVPIKFALDT